MKDTCPVCENEAQLSIPDRLALVDCPVCGKFKIDVLPTALSQRFEPQPTLRPLLRHWLCIRRDRSPIFLDEKLLDKIATGMLPAPLEQADNLIRWLGDKLRTQGNPAGRLHSDYYRHKLVSTAGAYDWDGVLYILRELKTQGLLTPDEPTGMTFAGWNRYDELQRAHSEGPIAFMAMSFTNDDVEWAYENCFKPATAAAGFELRKLTEKQAAGLIDVRMRVEIRKCRFLVCDLTNENRGAYWEAGFAEGLGKPVIYTCEKTYFDTKRTHFDTNHHLTLKWSKDQKDTVIEDLRDTIRETLPREANMSDDDAVR